MEATGFYEAVIDPRITVGWEQGNIVSSIRWVEASLPGIAEGKFPQACLMPCLMACLTCVGSVKHHCLAF